MLNNGFITYKFSAVINYLNSVISPSLYVCGIRLCIYTFLILITRYSFTYYDDLHFSVTHTNIHILDIYTFYYIASIIPKERKYADW